MKQYKRLAFNTLVFAIGNIGSKSISFLLLPLFTRYMSPSDYGKLDIINTTISLLVPILSFQIIEATFRFAVDMRENKNGRNVFSNAVIFSFVSLFFALGLYPLLRKVNIFSEYSVYFYAIFLLTILHGSIKQFVRGLGLVKLYAASDILYSAAFGISNLFFLVLLRLGVKAYLLSNIVAALSSITFLFIATSLWKYFEFKIDKNLLKQMLVYSIPLIPNSITWWVVTASDRYFLTYFLGYEATGIYSVAAKFPTLLMVIVTIFFQAWQLSAIEEYGKEGYNTFFKNVFGMLASVLFLALSILLVVIKPFMKFYVGDAFSESWRYTIFLLLAAVFRSFASFYGVNYTASKKTGGAFLTSVLAAGVNVTFLLILIPIIKIQAASLSSFLAYFTMWIARIFHTKKLVKTDIDIKHITLSFIVVLTQAILLLTLEDNTGLYVLQTFLLVILLIIQRKHLSRAIKFGKELIKSKKRN